MIKKIRRRTITETKRVAFLVNSAAPVDAVCELCGGGGAPMVSPLAAARILKTGTREIYRLIETGRIHFIELPDRQIFVCPQSIIIEKTEK
jgi:hypothetical protein